jgi:DNA polymerase III subunit chi
MAQTAYRTDCKSMAKVVFYLLDESPTEAEPAHFALACQLAARCYRSKQKCLVVCADKASAELFDELLWQLPADGFIPHNLAGEGPVGGAPVEVCWQNPNMAGRAVLINLAEHIPDCHASCKQIVDFVPAPEALKLPARERYKLYRAAGHQLDTLAAASLNEN